VQVVDLLRNAARSTSTICSMPGRCTFTTTSVKPVSSASASVNLALCA
jgi:hypothetical protein